MRPNEATVSFGSVTATRMTDRALLCTIGGAEHWIPLSQIHDDSEVFDASANSEGTLVVTEWIATQKGLV